MHVNGCPNSCARFQVADIGLRGTLMFDPYGAMVPGFQVHLGGSLDHSAGPGRKLRTPKVTASDVPNFVERITGRYLEQRTTGEPFAQWVRRADAVDLR